MALILGWIERQFLEKEREPTQSSPKLAPSLKYGLPQPLEEHAGRLFQRDNFGLMFALDALNKSSWFPFKPKDELLNLKAVRSLLNSFELSVREGMVSTIRLCVKLSNIFFDFLNNWWAMAIMQSSLVAGNIFKMAWYREGEGIGCAGDRFYCGVDYGMG